MRFLLILPQNYAFSNTSHLISRFLFCFSLTLHYLCGSAAKIGFGSEKKAKNFVFCFAFRSPCTTFELRSKVLPFESTKNILHFTHLIAFELRSKVLPFESAKNILHFTHLIVPLQHDL